jgi:hypothetical protein
MDICKIESRVLERSKRPKMDNVQSAAKNKSLPALLGSRTRLGRLSHLPDLLDRTKDFPPPKAIDIQCETRSDPKLGYVGNGFSFVLQFSKEQGDVQVDATFRYFAWSKLDPFGLAGEAPHTGRWKAEDVLIPNALGPALPEQSNRGDKVFYFLGSKVDRRPRD